MSSLAAGKFVGGDLLWTQHEHYGSVKVVRLLLLQLIILKSMIE